LLAAVHNKLNIPPDDDRLPGRVTEVLGMLRAIGRDQGATDSDAKMLAALLGVPE
jgi:hypothetical protein